MKEKYKDKFVRIDYVVSYPIEKSLLYSIVYVCQGHSIWASLHPWRMTPFPFQHLQSDISLNSWWDMVDKLLVVSLCNVAHLMYKWVASRWWMDKNKITRVWHTLSACAPSIKPPSHNTLVCKRDKDEQLRIQIIRMHVHACRVFLSFCVCINSPAGTSWCGPEAICCHDSSTTANNDSQKAGKSCCWNDAGDRCEDGPQAKGRRDSQCCLS